MNNTDNQKFSAPDESNPRLQSSRPVLEVDNKNKAQPESLDIDSQNKIKNFAIDGSATADKTSIRPKSPSIPAGEENNPSLNDSLDFSNPQTWGDFEVQQILGKGAMGTVYKGCQISLDRTVALKVLPPSLASDQNFLKRFELEAKAIAKISSPHVVQVYAAGNHDGQEYFAMEYVEGMDLGAKLEQGYKPSFREALDIVQQVARGLTAAAELNIIHRDIKPSNIMITNKNLVKIMDFGLVKLTGSETASLTMAGTLLGTVNYLSPEQGRGEDCDKRSDVYSLGIVLYELLTGKLPFAGDNPGSIIYQHNFVEPVPPREINPEIPKYHQALVLKCMKKKADDRYQDPRELIADIDLINKWKTPKTIKTSINSPGLLADESLTKSSEFPSDLAEEDEQTQPENLQKSTSQPQESSRLFMLGGIIVIFILGIGGLYKLNSANDGLISIGQARQMLTDGKYAQCRDVTEASLAVDPGDHSWSNLKRELDVKEGGHILHIAHLQLERGKPASSRTNALRVLQILPDNIEAEKLVNLINEREKNLEVAQLLLKEGKFGECRKIVRTNMETAKNDLAWVKIKTELDREEGNNLLRAARAKFYSSDSKTIRNHLLRVFELLPDNLQGEKLLGKLDKREHALEFARNLLSKNQFKQCREVIDHNITSDPNDPAWIALRAELNTKEGQNLLAKTKTEFEHNNHDTARDYIVRVLDLIPNNEEAKGLYAALIERDRDYGLAQQFLDTNSYQEARRIIDQHLSVSLQDPSWLALRISLNNKEGNNLLTAIEQDLNRSDYKSVSSKLKKLTKILPENDEVARIKERLKKRSLALDKARNLLQKKTFLECRQLVKRQRETAPEDSEWLTIWNDLISKESQHKIALMKFAFSRDEYDAAKKVAKEILEISPDNVDAKKMLEQIDQHINAVRTNHDDSRDAPAKKQTENDADKYSRQHVTEEENSSSNYIGDSSRTQPYPFDNKENMTGRLNLLNRMLNDKKQDIDILEEAIEDFIGDVGEDRDEVPELRRRLEDRRGEKNMLNTLESLDKAVMNQNQEQLNAIIKVKEHVAALTSLMGQPGLIFRHHIHSFKRDGDKAITNVILNHALLYMPATDIYYRYEAQRKGYRWIITSVQMLDRLN